MECRVLGMVEVVGADGETVPLGPPRQRAVFALLLMHAGELVTVDRIIDEIWGDRSPPSARHAVHVYVSDLRKRLNGCADLTITTYGPGYRLELPTRALDAYRMEEAVLTAEDLIDRAAYREAGNVLESGLELWRGPPYADFLYDDFAAAEIRRIEDLRMQAIELSIESEIAEGYAADVVGLLGSLTSEYPERERFWTMRVQALAASGRRAEALRVFHDAASFFRDEIGVPPPPELLTTRNAIAGHRPGVEPALTSGIASVSSISSA